MAKKMKFFGTAMAMVRKAPRNQNGKLRNKFLVINVRTMLEKVRSKDFDGADVIAKNIVTTPGLHK